MHFGEALASIVMRIVEASENEAGIHRHKNCYLFITLIMTTMIYGAVYCCIEDTIAGSSFEIQEDYHRTDGILFYNDDNYRYMNERKVYEFKWFVAIFIFILDFIYPHTCH